MKPMSKVAIIGAGPAGVICGNYLLNAGFEATIYEKNERVVSTPCGEGISDRAIKKLRKDTGFDSSPFISSSIYGLKNIFPGDYYSFIREAGYVLEREAWIDGIRRHFEKRGGEVRFNSNIQEFKKIPADYIIGADGPTSSVRRSIGGTITIVPAMQYKMKLEWQNHDWLEFYWDLEISDAYAWNFPKKDYFNVGVIGNINQLNSFCKKYRIEGEIIKKEGYPIPSNGKHISQGNVFLIGDAAGMANEFSKGGLAPSIYAADILSQCLKEGKGDEYETRIKRHPSFSKDYYDAMLILKSMTQKDLEIIGNLTHLHDLLNLPPATYVKALRHWRLIGKMQKILSAFKQGIIYAW